MKAQLMGTVKRGKITAEQAKHYLSLLTSTTNFEDLKNVDLVCHLKPFVYKMYMQFNK